MQLARALSADVDVVSVQYPGRQDRYQEEPFTAVAPLVEAVAEELAQELAADPGRPYALFGHSMGALVAFETARLLVARGELPMPQRLFLSGRGAPRPGTSAQYEFYDDADVLAELRRLGGTDQSMLENPEVLEHVLPALRADYRALAAYDWHGESPPAPITTLIGDSDPMVTVQEAATWQEQTRGEFDLKVFPGGHFYLVDQIDQVTAAVTEGLLAGAAS